MKNLLFLAHFHVLASKRPLMTSSDLQNYAVTLEAKNNKISSRILSIWRNCGKKEAFSPVFGIWPQNDLQWPRRSDLISPGPHNFGPRNNFCLIIYPQNLLPSVTFWSFKSKMASNGLKMASEAKSMLPRTFHDFFRGSLFLDFFEISSRFCVKSGLTSGQTDRRLTHLYI